MKRTLMATALALAAVHVFAQTANVGQSSDTSSAANSGAMAIGGGAVSATIGGNRNNNTARGGNGGNGQGGAASSNVTVNMGSGSDGSGTGSNATPNALAQQVPNGGGTIHEDIKTVGNPGSMSYGVSFSQYNCANTAGVGAGFMGGAFQIGVGKESDPCNSRANAAALFSIAQTLAPTNPQLSAQLYHAAILLIGNSTSATQEALKGAGVSDWVVASTTTPTPAIVPPAPAPAAAPETKAMPVPTPQVAATPIDAVRAMPLTIEPQKVEEPPSLPVTEPKSTDTASTETLDSVKIKMFLPASLSTAQK